jgi:hypothetical protein
MVQKIILQIKIQGVREWSPENFRVSLSGKMWSKTFIPFLEPFSENEIVPCCFGTAEILLCARKNLVSFDLKMIAW